MHKFTDNLHDTLRYERERADLELQREGERANFERDREQAHAADKIKILERQNEQQQNLFDRILAVEKQRVVDANEREHRAVEAERFHASEQLHFQEELHNVRLQLADRDKEIAQLRASDRTVVSGAHSLIGEFSSPFTTVTMSVPLYSSPGAASSTLPAAQLSQTDDSQLAICDVTDLFTLPPPLPADQRYPAHTLSVPSVPAPRCSDADLISDCLHYPPALARAASTQLTTVYGTPLVRPPTITTLTASVHDMPLSGVQSSFLPPALPQTLSTHVTTPAPDIAAKAEHTSTMQTGPTAGATVTTAITVLPERHSILPAAQSTHAPVSAIASATTAAAVPVSSQSFASIVQSATQSVAPAPIVIKQQQKLKPYNGTTSWRSFKDHFHRTSALNNWTTDAEKVQTQ